jgi:hypothetical protein
MSAFRNNCGFLGSDAAIAAGSPHRLKQTEHFKKNPWPKRRTSAVTNPPASVTDPPETVTNPPSG